MVTEYFYAETLLVYSIGYNYYENAKSAFVAREEKRYYDRNDNLIKKVVDDHLRGMRSYVSKYDNYDTWKYEYE